MAKRDFSPLEGAYYEGGKKALDKHVRTHLQYPSNALQAGVEGTVHLFLNINHKGEVTQVRVISGIGHGCDDEAVRVVKLMKFHVKKVRNMHIVYHHKLQIHFRLRKQQTARAEIPTPEVETGLFEVAFEYVIVPTPPKKAKGKTLLAAPNSTAKVAPKPKVTYTYTI